MKVVRYFHLRPFMEMKGGATVKVVGDTDNPAQVDVQFVKCSRKDAFCKKTGRSFADKAPLKVVPLRYLPNELERIGAKVGVDNLAADYFFACRYFLPKE